MKKLLCAALLLVSLTLAGCGDKLDGEVTDKVLVDGYSYTYLQPIYTTSCSGTPSICTTSFSYFIPMTAYVPPCYRLYVKTDEGKEKHGCVEHSRWSKVKIGQHYTGKDVGKRAHKERMNA